eukprot:3453697-Pleurochrysis_carterae.AAC.1
MSISSQQSSVHAACALAGAEVTPKRSACQSSDAGVEMYRDAVDVSGHSVHLRLAGRIVGVMIVVAVFVLGEDVERRVIIQG